MKNKAMTWDNKYYRLVDHITKWKASAMGIFLLIVLFIKDFSMMYNLFFFTIAYVSIVAHIIETIILSTQECLFKTSYHEEELKKDGGRDHIVVQLLSELATWTGIFIVCARKAHHDDMYLISCLIFAVIIYAFWEFIRPLFGEWIALYIYEKNPKKYPGFWK